jgi:hypothetical protein
VTANGKPSQYGTVVGIDDGHRAAAAKCNVHAAAGVFNETTRFIASRELCRRHDRHRIELNGHDLIAVRIGHRDARPAADEGKRTAGERRRRIFGFDDGFGVSAGVDRGAAGLSAEPSVEETARKTTTAGDGRY